MTPLEQIKSMAKVSAMAGTSTRKCHSFARSLFQKLTEKEQKELLAEIDRLQHSNNISDYCYGLCLASTLGI